MRWLDRLLLVFAGLVVLASLLPLGARLSWVLELTAHFRLQYLGAALMLLLLLALRRRWRACLALVAAGAVSLASVAPYLPFGARTEPQPGTTLIKVVTVNISFRPFSARRLLEIIAEADPDILIAQEFTPYAEGVLADLDAKFLHSVKFPADGATGIALWSRFDLESGDTFALGRLPALEARVRGPSGVFTVIGAHLSAPTSTRRAAARNEQLRELGARSAAIAGPLVVAGDFNITPYSPYFRDWLRASGLTDSRRGRTLSPSWPALLPIVAIPIDHVNVSRDFAVLAHHGLANFESDHLGVLVELALRADSATESP